MGWRGVEDANLGGKLEAGSVSGDKHGMSHTQAAWASVKRFDPFKGAATPPQPTEFRSCARVEVDVLSCPS